MPDKRPPYEVAMIWSRIPFPPPTPDAKPCPIEPIDMWGFDHYAFIVRRKK
jgi:hypothetical protein